MTYRELRRKLERLGCRQRLAHKALEEGLPEVAQVFQEVAGAETIHGLNHLRVAGGVESTVENLCTVTTGEAKEFSTMYPRMIAGRCCRDFRPGPEPRGASPGDVQQRPGRPGDEAQPYCKCVAAWSGCDVNRPAAGDTGSLRAGTRYLGKRCQGAGPGALAGCVFGKAAGGGLRGAGRHSQHRRPGNIGAVALERQVAVLVAGLAAAAAGTISMATGAFLGSRAELDVQRAEIAKEARELEENPGEEYAELVVAFQREGKSYEEARAMADEIAQDKDLWLRTMAEKELGISFEETTSPVKDALVMGLSFIKPPFCPSSPTCS